MSLSAGKCDGWRTLEILAEIQTQTLLFSIDDSDQTCAVRRLNQRVVRGSLLTATSNHDKMSSRHSGGIPAVSLG